MNLNQSNDAEELTMKEIEVREQDGWKPIEFERLMIGDEFRVVKGHTEEIGKVYLVNSEPQICEPEGNYALIATLIGYIQPDGNIAKVS